MEKLYSVKDVRELTGLTGKELYYFDHENVVPPTSTSNYSVEGNRGYKLYDDAAVARLQQIAMYYELGLKRNEIRDIMKAPDYEVNKALDELTHALEEKRLKLDRHIAAIHSLRYVGIKNGMLGWINGIRIEELGRNILATEHSSLAKVWSADIEKASIDAFEITLYDNLEKLAALDDRELNGEQGHELLTGIFQSGSQHLGLPGYLYVLGMFLSAIGDGSAIEEIFNDIPVSVTAPQGKAALCYIKRDAKQLLNETAHVIAENYSTIGKPFDTPEVTAMIESIKKLLANHYGIKHYEEYKLIFEQISFPPYTEREDYLGYVMNALRFHCIKK